MLKIEYVCKSFDGKKVLDGVCLDVKKGETVCIMAPSGAGKTTLANIIMGLLKPDSGRVVTAPNTVFSCAFQQDRLLPQLDSVQNIRFVNQSLTDGEIMSALKAVDMSDDAKRPCAVLSGGQKRRIAIVRAMLAKSDIVMIDEPFKGLDDAVKTKAAEFIKTRQSSRALLCITHDAEDAKTLGARIFTL